jgi:hypothetical protein
MPFTLHVEMGLEELKEFFIADIFPVSCFQPVSSTQVDINMPVNPAFPPLLSPRGYKYAEVPARARSLSSLYP